MDAQGLSDGEIVDEPLDEAESDDDELGDKPVAPPLDDGDSPNNDDAGASAADRQPPCQDPDVN